VGHGMSYLGVLCKQRGGTFDVLGGVPGCLVLNPDPRLWAKEGRGIDGLLLGKRAIAQGRKQSGRGRPHPLGKEKPRRVEPTGCGGGLGLLTIAR
jgi:hypothetical protein